MAQPTTAKQLISQMSSVNELGGGKYFPPPFDKVARSMDEVTSLEFFNMWVSYRSNYLIEPPPPPPTPTHYFPLPHPYRRYPFVQITCLVHDWPRRSLRPSSDDRCTAPLWWYRMQSDLLLVLQEQTERRRATRWPRHER